MPSAYYPSDDIVREHLTHLRETAHLPVWQRADSSLELLLGLRDPAVDEQLTELIPRLSTEIDGFWTLGPDALRSALGERSIVRISRVVKQTTSALALAWLKPTASETAALVAQLSSYLVERKQTYGVPTAVFTTLCDVVRRFGPPLALEPLRAVGALRWIERAALAGGDVGATAREQAGVALHPDISPALFRDPLTGLLSRNVLFDAPHRLRLPNWSEIAVLPARGVIMLDVDRMKRILDFYGMPSGDHVLVALAEHLQTLFGDRVVRFGGDEMLVLWDGSDLREMAQKAVESIRTLRISTPDAPTEELRVSVSAGVATGTEPIAVLRAAEDALSRAKLGGRDRVEFA